MTDAKRMRIDATALREDSFILMQGAQPFTFTGIGATRWAGITLPLDHPCLDPRTLEVLAAGRSVRKRTQAECLTHLRGLVNRMLSSDPAVRIATPSAGATLEQDISLAIARVLESSCDDRETKRLRLHADFSDTATQSQATVGGTRSTASPQASERMGPIAESFGGYDFSAFARDYRALFSELPSETAQASEREPGAKASLGWLVCAATFHAQAERNNAALSRSATSGRSSAV